MKPKVLVDYFIRPACDYISEYCPNCNGPNSVQMMLAIAAQESHCGMYFKQVGGGPARGVWQVETRSSEDVLENFVAHKNGLADLLMSMYSPVLKYAHIQSPLYNCAIARLILYRYPEAMPDLDDKDGMWEFYKHRYNSEYGAAEQHEWDKNWDMFVAGISI